MSVLSISNAANSAALFAASQTAAAQSNAAIAPPAESHSDDAEDAVKASPPPGTGQIVDKKA